MTGRRLWAVLLIAGLVACNTGTVETDTADFCEPFPIAEAESLIANLDTGVRYIEGPILATAAVRDSHQTPQGSDLWVVAVNVYGVVVLLAHDVTRGDAADGPGLWVALDQTSGQITGFPLNSDAPNPWPISSRGAAWDCVADS